MGGGLIQGRGRLLAAACNGGTELEDLFELEEGRGGTRNPTSANSNALTASSKLAPASRLRAATLFNRNATPCSSSASTKSGVFPSFTIKHLHPIWTEHLV